MTVISSADKANSKGRIGVFLLPYLMTIGCCLTSLLRTSMNTPTVGELAVTLTGLLLATGGLHAFAALLIRRFPLRELLVSLAIICLGTYGNVKLSANTIMPQNAYLAVWLLVFAALGAAIWKVFDDKLLMKCVSNLLIFSCILVGMQFTMITYRLTTDSLKLSSLDGQLAPDPNVKRQPTAGSTASKLPDIYYIIVDAYAREDILRDLYDFDNSEFTSSLQQRGFSVGQNSRSNYHLTELSLASSLNMDYLDKFQLERFATRTPVRKLIQDGKVVRQLRTMGYETVAFGSGKVDTECKGFDRYLQPSLALSDFQDGIIHRTPIPDLLRPLDQYLWTPADARRQHLLSALDGIGEVSRHEQQPMFVFAHMLCPHPPYVFDASGNPISLHGHNLLADGVCYLRYHNWDRKAYGQAYCAQLQYLNQRLLTVVDSIQKRTNGQAVIVIQGDHGPRMYSDFTLNSNLREAFGILNAVYLPNGAANSLDLQSPVNSFRQIFNKYFGTDYELESSRSIYETDPYTFVDVTERAENDGLDQQQ